MARILSFLTDDEEARLLGEAARREYADGEVIVREGERTRALFILREGEARVERSHGEFSVEISRLHAGELFGEMGFVEDFEASASVVAEGRCVIDVIADEHVHAMTSADAAFAGRFYHSIALILSQRLRATSVQALSEFSWGTGHFARPADDASVSPAAPDWGGGSPLRDLDAEDERR